MRSFDDDGQQFDMKVKSNKTIHYIIQMQFQERNRYAM